MRVAIIGANGQLGFDLAKVFSTEHEVLPLTHAEIEISDIDHVSTVIKDIRADAVINTAAYHNVPLCEKDPGKANEINAIGALNLAKVAAERNIRLVHYSTDYVFDGQKKSPYSENDNTNPLNVYAVTKLAGENFALNYHSRSYVLRVSGIYGQVPCRAKGGNFITTMLKLAKEKEEVRVVQDEVLTPTPTHSIAVNTLSLLESDAYGLYHMTCEGQTSWYEFAKTIWETLKLKTPLYPASVSDFPVIVKRPFYSVLENQGLKDLKINNMPHWRHALTDFLQAYYL